MSDYLSDATLDAIGAALGGFNDRLCLITRPTTTRGVGGAPTSGPDTGVATVPCRLVSGAAAERLIGGRLAAETEYVAILPRGTHVPTDGHITVSDGTRLDVVSVPDLASNLAELPVQVRRSG